MGNQDSWGDALVMQAGNACLIHNCSWVDRASWECTCGKCPRLCCCQQLERNSTDLRKGGAGGPGAAQSLKPLLR